MPTNDIVTAFGLPNLVETVGKDTLEWRYGLPAFPADEDINDSYVVGLILGITNGRLAGWTCAYAGPSEMNPSREDATGRSPTATGIRLDSRSALKLFLVSATPLPEGRFIDTQQLPSLGFIRPEPDLEISTIIEVSWKVRAHAQENGQDRRVWSFSIYLKPEDASRLEELTATHVSRQLLIVIGDVPISAPRVMSRLDAGSIVVECDESLPIEEIKEQLTNMSRRVP